MTLHHTCSLQFQFHFSKSFKFLSFKWFDVKLAVYYTGWPKLFWKNPYKNPVHFQNKSVQSVHFWGKNPYKPYIFGEKIRPIRTFLGKKSVKSVHFWEKIRTICTFKKKNPYSLYILFEKIRTILTILEKKSYKPYISDKIKPFLKNTHQNSIFLLQFLIHCPLWSCVRV